MAEERLIDANVLLEYAEKMKRQDWGSRGIKYLSNKIVEQFVCEVKALPTVDAEKVVRCKDCKHARERTAAEKKYLVNGVYICTSYEATEYQDNPVWREHYCSYGERRADGAKE